MDYYETRRSLIQYLNSLVSHDRWRIKYGIPSIVVASDLYKILLDVLSEHVNVRYGNLADANEEDIYRTSREYIKSFDDEDAIHYIRIVYFLYTQLLGFDHVPPWRIMEKICDTIRRGKYDQER